LFFCWHQKDHFSTFDGKLQLQYITNGVQNLPYFSGSLHNTFIIYSAISHHQIFQNYFGKKQNLETHESENMKIPKPRFTNIERTVKDNSSALAKKAVPSAGSPVAIQARHLLVNLGKSRKLEVFQFLRNYFLGVIFQNVCLAKAAGPAAPSF